MKNQPHSNVQHILKHGARLATVKVAMCSLLALIVVLALKRATKYAVWTEYEDLP